MVKTMNLRTYNFCLSLLEKYDYKLPNHNNDEEERKVKKDIDDYKESFEKKGIDLTEEESYLIKKTFDEIHNKWVLHQAEKIMIKKVQAMIENENNLKKGDDAELAQSFLNAEAELNKIIDMFEKTPIAMYATDFASEAFREIVKYLYE